MKKLSANEIRATWLRFFSERGHSIEPGASLVPHNDPTLLWINSGVAALKKYFDGSVTPPNRRITNVQKSIRTNDIDNVGKTARHHTFFEMLGNFSIGDYFRESAIPWAFEILTSPKYFAMPVDKLYFTYLPTDLDTRNLWLKCGVKADHLIPLEGNFWQIGTGPCGPNTEVFFDRGPAFDPDNRGLRLLEEELDNDRYVEIWGIVFSQYNGVEGVVRADYAELPYKNIDTGAGLERIACVLQQTPTNFETDLFYPLIKATHDISKVAYEGVNLMAYRVIADHIRTCTFALADGANFSNEGRGYVLRRLLRRAMRYGRKIGIYQPFLYLLVPTVIRIMDDFYPYLDEKEDNIAKKILAEEEKFLKTLTSGEKQLEKMLVDQPAKLSAEATFKLYDTYGFPFELTAEIAEENGVSIDRSGFNALLEKQRERARSARKDAQSMANQSVDLMECHIPSVFDYSSTAPLVSKVVALFRDGQKVEEIEDYGEVILATTNFYAESGGQVADRGFLTSKKCEAEVTDVQKAPNGQHLHVVTLNFGTISLGDEITSQIDVPTRLLTMRNHSATHLLDQVLADVLGDEVHQQGSSVDSDHLRFDFNYAQALTIEQINEIERRVNQQIANGLVNTTLLLPLAEAKKRGAKSLFDEKYGATVRVVEFGNFSSEFCGGTHVANSEDIGVFVIEFERSIASGIRRIQAKTSLGAYNLLKEREKILFDTKEILGAGSYVEILTTLKTLENEKQRLKELNRSLADKLAAAEAETLAEQFVVYDGVHLLVNYLPKLARSALIGLIDVLKAKNDDGVIVLIGQESLDSYPIVASVGPKALKQGIKAGQIVQTIAKKMLGSGGGRVDFANGAGKVKPDINEINKIIKELID
ncbi:MAG TPA: alanine--tRNA ligase [Bacilli bacterium]|nr:alanine--tRNA ligase [Bacilli bacterium]